MDILKPDTVPFTVTQLNRQVRSWLEHDLGMIHVIGELSNLSKPASGHWYFTLKDESAQLRCVFFRNHHLAGTKDFCDGQQIIAKGRLSLYEARGDYQLIVNELSQAGIGELYQQFERLKAKLEQQGLFLQHRKKVLKRFPVTIAVITSASGAALRDILSTLSRRFPIAGVHIYPCEVQGKNAAAQLTDAIVQANKDNHSDVILLARGGGSMEDLWAFNDEQLALAISNSGIPVVSGVGHETDFTIADFVADLRAATPTAAAEAVTPDQGELLSVIDALMRRMTTAVLRLLRHHQLLLTHQIAYLSSPEQRIGTHWQTLDYHERQLNQHMHRFLSHQQHRLQIAFTALQSRNPAMLLQQLAARLQALLHHLHQTMVMRFTACRQLLTQQMAMLHAVSPLATLDRGYAIATCHKRIIFNSNQVHPGDTVCLQLANGRLACKVTSTEA